MGLDVAPHRAADFGESMRARDTTLRIRYRAQSLMTTAGARAEVPSYDEAVEILEAAGERVQ